MMLLKSDAVSDDVGLFRYTKRTYVVFSIFGLPELIDEVLKRLWRGAHEAKTSEVTQFLAGVAV